MTPIDVLLKLQWEQLVAVGVVVTMFTQLVKGKLTILTGHWLLIVPLLVSGVLCFYIYGTENIMRSVVATLLTAGISVGGWQTLKGSTTSGLNGSQNK